MAARMLMLAALLAAVPVAAEEEPPLLETGGNMATVYTGELMAVDGSVVTVHGKFLPDAEGIQAIRCKLSSFKTQGVRWYSVADTLENVFIGVPIPDSEDNDNQRVLDAVGKTVRVAPLGDVCLRFELIE